MTMAFENPPPRRARIRSGDRLIDPHSREGRAYFREMFHKLQAEEKAARKERRGRRFWNFFHRNHRRDDDGD